MVFQFVHNLAGNDAEQVYTYPAGYHSGVLRANGGDVTIRTTATTGDAFTLVSGNTLDINSVNMERNVIYVTAAIGVTLQGLFAKSAPGDAT